MTLLVFVLVAVVSGNAEARNKALLIGVGEYKEPSYNLGGIEMDVEVMKRFSQKLGFAPDDIKVLLNDDASRENIESAFKDFLGKGVGPTDTVLIYYSGHGVQITDRNNDEDDGRDEALTLTELKATVNGWDGVLLDDDLELMLAALPSDNIFVVVDACHSGTVTKDLTEVIPLNTKAYDTKSFQVKALPFLSDKSVPRSSTQKSVDNVEIGNDLSGVVTLSAAQDDEKALATTQGSIFTLALYETLELSDRVVTPEELRNATSNKIKSTVDNSKVFSPNLTGDDRMFNRAIVAKTAESRGEVNWSDVLTMSEGLTPLKVRLDRFDYQRDQEIQLRVDVPNSGYLNVISVDSNDSIVLLYPNSFDPDNRLEAGNHLLPGNSSYDWVAQSPWGRNMIVALFTAAPLNFYQSTLQKDRNGNPTSDYVIPSPSDIHTPLANRAGGQALGKALFFNTCETLEDCGSQ